MQKPWLILVSRYAAMLVWCAQVLQEGADTEMFDFVAQAEFAAILKDYVGRESPLYHAERLSERYRRCFLNLGSYMGQKGDFSDRFLSH